MKNGHSEDGTYRTTSITKSKRVSNFYCESFTLKLIEVKRKASNKKVLWLFFTSFMCL